MRQYNKFLLYIGVILLCVLFYRQFLHLQDASKRQATDTRTDIGQSSRNKNIGWMNI